MTAWTVTNDAMYKKLLRCLVLVNIQHNTPLHWTRVCHNWTFVAFYWLFETFIKLILHMCCFVLDGSPHSNHACVVEEAFLFGCSYGKRSFAPGQRSISYHYEHMSWWVMVPASYPSIILTAPCTIWTSYIFLIWRRIYEEHELIIKLRLAMRYKNTTDH